MFSILTLMAYIITAQTQIATTFGDISLNFSLGISLSLFQDPASPLFPNDFYRRIQLGLTYIYTLGSNNIV